MAHIILHWLHEVSPSAQVGSPIEQQAYLFYCLSSQNLAGLQYRQDLSHYRSALKSISWNLEHGDIFFQTLET